MMRLKKWRKKKKTKTSSNYLKRASPKRGAFLFIALMVDSSNQKEVRK